MLDSQANAGPEPDEYYQEQLCPNLDCPGAWGISLKTLRRIVHPDLRYDRC